MLQYKIIYLIELKRKGKTVIHHIEEWQVIGFWRGTLFPAPCIKDYNKMALLSADLFYGTPHIRMENYYQIIAVSIKLRLPGNWFAYSGLRNVRCLKVIWFERQEYRELLSLKLRLQHKQKNDVKSTFNNSSLTDLNRNG